MDQPRGVKDFIDSDVLTEAKKRIHHIMDTFDEMYISFSGGKDSLVVLELAEECRLERGETKKLEVIFRDEELIPPEVAEYVQSVYHSGRFDMKYFCLQMIAHKYILGKKETIIQWDAKRDHVREMPEFAIRDQSTVFDQYTSNYFVTDYYSGKVCMILGLRAAESLHRLNGIKSKKVETHIACSKNSNIWNGRPIYDWLEKDVFRYFYDRGIKYNPTYDHQMFNKQPLRVSSTISVESANHYHKMQTLYPEYFDKVCQLFPDLLLQTRYAKQFDREAIMYTYAHSWKGIFDYIEENLEGSQAAIAKKRVIEAMTNRENKIKLDPNDTLGGFPVKWVFHAVVLGQYKRGLILKPKPDASDYEFEGIPVPEHLKK